MLMELLAYKAYRSPDLEIRFWKSHDKKEVDFVLNDKELVIEIKSGNVTSNFDLKGLGCIAEDGPIRKRLVVSLETEPRTVKDAAGIIEIHPWREFLRALWGGELSI